ncbi:DeoR/GlpR transcriptional regulator [Pedobacter sp. BS3]|uniref:DeoR/GlpR family DNA-binding transcription regulator n=1 Tax=Pedobacter sp. BS3 TaxID=2567937 RepID=UPI0011EC1172|nr:DeoR/GlpR family DNA-binding transcription regulator [Pedobacter sp. BS3]TZF82220.1 DeoR/GlpR transcriptional regulator [Pedobacter sp. BS3]
MLNLIDRHKYILKQLRETGHVNVQNLSAELEVSDVTIRKDLKLLEDKNLLYRTHGGGYMKSPYTSDKPVDEKEHQAKTEKEKIAKEAAKLIDQNDSIIIASGTTVLALARMIKPQQHLTVITSALNVALELSHHQNVEVLQLGGQLRQNSSSVAGMYAELILQDVSCSILFLGVDGIDAAGLTTTSLAEAHLNQKMMQAAQTTVVLADSSKFGRRGMGKICALDQVQHIITDEGISANTIKLLESNGIKVTIAQ